DLHLEECAFEDASLTGMPRPEVPFDFDVEARDSVAPFAGADEPAGGPPQVFAGPTLFASGTRSLLMASADLDDDGDIDLAVTNVEPNSGGNDVTILLNNGTGVFSDPQHLPFGTDPTQIEIGYVNGGDILDLVVLAGDGIHVRFGAGGGIFSPPSTVVGEGPWTDIELADYDDDGDTDVFTLRSPPADSAEVIVYINEGDGTFVFNNFWTVGRYADDLEIVDLDGDGFQDLLVVDNTSTSQLYTLRSRGIRAPGVSDGYDPPRAYPYSVESVPAASQFLVGDFDGDLDPDVILGDAMADSLVLIRNDGDGTFGAREAFGVHRRGAPRTATMLDYEGDGDLDLVVASQGSTVDLMLNDGNGMFNRFALCGNGVLSGFPNAILAGRLDDDMSTDIAVLTTNDEVEILTNLNWTSPIANEEAKDQPAESSRLYPNYPNPFNAATTLHIELAQPTAVSLIVNDLLGRQIATVTDESLTAGKHAVQFDADGLASGVYFYRIKAGDFVDTRRMVIVR
ncbi:MAG: T9SS type A sorting domain-containing protein, partial [Rhodothermia bacterium]|nr:T9SS type A sorting domain-containing protein [Rhodothermia bacterium]